MIFGIGRRLWTAVTFLTIAPARRHFFDKPVRIAEGAVFFPVVGAALGAIFCLAAMAGEAFIPRPSLIVLLFLLSYVLTGGLHVDGLSDTADGLAVGRKGNSTRALEIMRSGAAGPGGVFAILLVYLFKFTALLSLDAGFFAFSFFGMFLASRWGIVLAGAFWSAAKNEGLGSQFIMSLRGRDFLGASLPGLLLCGLFCWWKPEYIAFFGVGVLSALFFAWLTASVAARRLGGLTGDVLGAVSETAEAGFLLGVLLISQ